MSGGEQQMLALGRALMLAPKILLVDEPSVGLAPILVSRTIDKIKELRERLNLTVLMAGQNLTQAPGIADRAMSSSTARSQHSARPRRAQQQRPDPEVLSRFVARASLPATGPTLAGPVGGA
jgi:ABC-type branched-subunit amino acid transport system ATPase component